MQNSDCRMANEIGKAGAIKIGKSLGHKQERGPRKENDHQSTNCAATLDDPPSFVTGSPETPSPLLAGARFYS